MQALEQLLDGAPTIGQDIGARALYSFVNQPVHYEPPPDLLQAPGAVMRTSYELDNGWRLQERFDFSGHGGTEPHINYELMNPSGSVDRPLSTKLLKDDHMVTLDYFK